MSPLPNILCTYLLQIESGQQIGSFGTLVIGQINTIRFKPSCLPLLIPPEFLQISGNQTGLVVEGRGRQYGGGGSATVGRIR